MAVKNVKQIPHWEQIYVFVLCLNPTGTLTVLNTKFGYPFSPTRYEYTPRLLAMQNLQDDCQHIRDAYRNRVIDPYDEPDVEEPIRHVEEYRKCVEARQERESEARRLELGLPPTQDTPDATTAYSYIPSDKSLPTPDYQDEMDGYWSSNTYARPGDTKEDFEMLWQRLLEDQARRRVEREAAFNARMQGPAKNYVPMQSILVKPELDRLFIFCLIAITSCMGILILVSCILFLHFWITDTRDRTRPSASYAEMLLLLCVWQPLVWIISFCIWQPLAWARSHMKQILLVYIAWTKSHSRRLWNDVRYLHIWTRIHWFYRSARINTLRLHIMFILCAPLVRIAYATYNQQHVPWNIVDGLRVPYYMQQPRSETGSNHWGQSGVESAPLSLDDSI